MRVKEKALKKKLILSTITVPLMVMLLNIKTYAATTIGTQEVETATQNIRDAVIKLAMPVGSVLMFVSIVIIAIKLIVNANNPNKRSEGIGGLAWVAGGFMLLSLALIVSGIVLSVATNGSGAMVGGGGTV
ncbi:MAG: hypothetical protein ACLTBX_05145 [Clostridia bacterium]